MRVKEQGGQRDRVNLSRVFMVMLLCECSKERVVQSRDGGDRLSHLLTATDTATPDTTDLISY